MIELYQMLNITSTNVSYCMYESYIHHNIHHDIYVTTMNDNGQGHRTRTHE